MAHPPALNVPKERATRNGNNGKQADGEKPPAFDEGTIAFAGCMSDYARSGQAEEPAQVLSMGLPSNIRTGKGDTLVMLASYHGHADAARRLLDAGADPVIANDRGQSPLAGACFKPASRVTRTWCARCWTAGRGGGGRSRWRWPHSADDGGHVQPHEHRGNAAGPRCGPIAARLPQDDGRAPGEAHECSRHLGAVGPGNGGPVGIGARAPKNFGSCKSNPTVTAAYFPVRAMGPPPAFH